MKKPMSAELKAKLREGREANSKRFEGQTILVDENWRIRRDDEWNWTNEEKVSGKWVFRGFYGKLNAALMALPATMLGEQAKSSLEQVLECLKGIKYSILAALPEAKRIEEISAIKTK